MKYTLFYLLCSALIPELSADISTGSSCDIHLILVGTVRKTNVTGVKKNFLKLTLDKSHFITGIEKDKISITIISIVIISIVPSKK